MTETSPMWFEDWQEAVGGPLIVCKKDFNTNPFFNRLLNLTFALLTLNRSPLHMEMMNGLLVVSRAVGVAVSEFTPGKILAANKALPEIDFLQKVRFEDVLFTSLYVNAAWEYKKNPALGVVLVNQLVNKRTEEVEHTVAVRFRRIFLVRKNIDSKR